MKIAFIAPYGVDCGIATYSQKLITDLMRLGIDVEVYSNIESSRTIINNIEKSGVEIIHIQHEFGIFSDTDKFISLLSIIQKLGKKVIVTMHSEKNIYINMILKYVDKLILHNDLNNYSKSNRKVVKIPHSIPYVHFQFPKQFYRKKFGISPKLFVIGTAGFLNGYRGIERIVEELADFVAMHKDIFVHLVTSAKLDNDSQKTAIAIKDRILNIADKNDFLDRIYIGLDFKPFEEYYERIFTLDLGFSYAPELWTSSSGSATDMIGCLVPLVVNDVIHFRNIRNCCWCVRTYKDIATKIIQIYKDSRETIEEKNDVIRSEINNKSSFEIALKHFNVYKNLFNSQGGGIV